MIPVTKPFKPPIEEYHYLLKGIWDRTWFTNNGPLVNELELSLKSYLEVPNLLYVSNGTIALQIALKALGITKKVITTPFSYVATTSSIVWEGCQPVYVDIDKETLNIDPLKIEAAIDEDTEAILATHCFGNPCDIDAIDLIAKKFNLKVIYDAAHCFGTKYKGKSVFSYGDISTVSFHSTKLYHSIEGGAVFASDPEVMKRMSFMRNFGHDGPERFEGVGINGKNSEFHAAMGIINLTYVDDILHKRRQLVNVYDLQTRALPLTRPVFCDTAESNNSYYPIIFRTEEALLRTKVNLENHKIFPRRYFYPSLNLLKYVNGACPVSEDISARILCLPLFHDLNHDEQRYCIDLVKSSLIK